MPRRTWYEVDVRGYAAFGGGQSAMRGRRGGNIGRAERTMQRKRCGKLMRVNFMAGSIKAGAPFDLPRYANPIRASGQVPDAWRTARLPPGMVGQVLLPAPNIPSALEV